MDIKKLMGEVMKETATLTSTYIKELIEKNNKLTQEVKDLEEEIHTLATDDVADRLRFEKEETEKLKRIYGVNIYGDIYLRYTIYDQDRTHYYLVAIDVKDGYKAQDEHKHICVLNHIIDECLQEESEIYNCLIEEYEFVSSFKELPVNLPH